ncbi:hypothetical protein vseg_012509 [Gypsophila vaccaria]
MHNPNNPSSPMDSTSSLARPPLMGSHMRTPLSASNPLHTHPLSQNFQGAQTQQPSHQPWLSTPQGRPPMPSLRPQVTSPALQQRTHIPQQSLQQPMAATSQSSSLLSFSQQHQPQQQQQPAHYAVSIQSQDNTAQLLSITRNPQPLMNPDQISRVQASGTQRPSAPPVITRSGPADNVPSVEALESCTRILSKRNIQELVHQVDPLENLDPEVEDVLVEIADDFIDSVISFGCSLAKHRKSDTLEAKDILLHLDRTWNMTFPGFGGDEIKTCKKPVGNDMHKERLTVIKKSLTGVEVNKSSAGQAAGNIKGQMAKPTQSAIGS